MPETKLINNNKAKLIIWKNMPEAKLISNNNARRRTNKQETPEI